MIPDEWMYWVERKREREGEGDQVSQNTRVNLTPPPPAEITETPSVFTSCTVLIDSSLDPGHHLQPVQHLVDQELHPVLRQPLQLHQLAQVSAHEWHHQITAAHRRCGITLFGRNVTTTEVCSVMNDLQIT